MADPTVEVNVEEPNPEPEDTTVVIVNNDDDNNTDNQDMALIVGQLQAKVDQLTEELENANAQIANAQITADIAIDVAEEAQVENDVVEAVVEEIEESEPEPEPVEADEPPAKLPWTHRPMRGFFSRD
jgi:hypothetical protein